MRVFIDLDFFTGLQLIQLKIEKLIFLEKGSQKPSKLKSPAKKTWLPKTRATEE